MLVISLHLYYKKYEAELITIWRLFRIYTGKQMLYTYYIFLNHG